jgi:hypothetical protein
VPNSGLFYWRYWAFGFFYTKSQLISKMDFKEIGCEDGSCKDWAQDRVQWRHWAFRFRYEGITRFVKWIFRICRAKDIWGLWQVVGFLLVLLRQSLWFQKGRVSVRQSVSLSVTWHESNEGYVKPTVMEKASGRHLKGNSNCPYRICFIVLVMNR